MNLVLQETDPVLAFFPLILKRFYLSQFKALLKNKYKMVIIFSVFAVHKDLGMKRQDKFNKEHAGSNWWEVIIVKKLCHIYSK
jgi:hypothetical protein